MQRFVLAKNSVLKTRLGAKFISAKDGEQYFIKKDTILRVLDLMYTKDSLLCGVENTTTKYAIPYTFVLDHCDLVNIQTGKMIEVAFLLKNELKDNITVHNVAIAALIINAVALIGDIVVKLLSYIH